MQKFINLFHKFTARMFSRESKHLFCEVIIIIKKTAENGDIRVSNSV